MNELNFVTSGENIMYFQIELSITLDQNLIDKSTSDLKINLPVKNKLVGLYSFMEASVMGTDLTYVTLRYVMLCYIM